MRTTKLTKATKQEATKQEATTQKATTQIHASFVGFVCFVVRIAVALRVLGPTLVIAQTAVPRLPPASPNPPAPSVQAPADPGYAALIATCKTPPPARGGSGRGGGARGAPPPQGVRDYSVAEISGVIRAGQKWAFLWQQAGNNGDGIVGLNDGSLLIAQNDSSDVLKLTQESTKRVAITLPINPNPSVTVPSSNPRRTVLRRSGYHSFERNAAP